jgi:hypothetical protein
MTVGFNASAEFCLSEALAVALETSRSTRGCNMCFPIRESHSVTPFSLINYCNDWVEIDSCHSEWRPRFSPNDNTVIKLTARGLIQVQGRNETVSALAVIAAGLANGIPAELAMHCPASSKFWDFIEQKHIQTSSGLPRPVTTFFPEKKEPLIPVPKTIISNPILDESTIQMMEKSITFLRESPVNLSPVSSLWEANEFLSNSLDVVLSNKSSFLRTKMEYPHTITLGQLLLYCRIVWPDSQLYHLSTRWRPKNVRGGIFMTNGCICIEGSERVRRGLAVVAAGLRIRLPPDLVRETESFTHSFLQLSLPRNAFIEKGLGVAKLPETDKTINQDCGLVDPYLGEKLLSERDKTISQVIEYLRAEFSKTSGQYCGCKTLGQIRWSEEEFVNHVLGWHSEAEIQTGSQLRYVPAGMPKGGLTYYYPGTRFSVQGSVEWLELLLPLLASLVCGMSCCELKLCGVSQKSLSLLARTSVVDQLDV